MFEMTVSTSKARSKDISYIVGKLRSAVKSMKGIMVCEEFDGRTKLAIAVNEKKKDLMLSLIFDAVSEAIVRSYKEEFLIKNIKIVSRNKLVMSTLVKALTLFDKDSDKQLIKKQLAYCEELYIDSFYHFRLWELEERWGQICRLVEENSAYLYESNSLGELMKFLIATGETELDEIHLHAKRGSVGGFSSAGKEIFKLSYKKDETSKIDVVSKLIDNLPEKIIVYDEVDGELAQLLMSIFDGKVSLRK